MTGGTAPRTSYMGVILPNMSTRTKIDRLALSLWLRWMLQGAVEGLHGAIFK